MALAENLVRSKIVAIALIVLPGLWPVWPLFVRQDPSTLADPLKFILHHLGFVACVLLALVLSFTPLRVLFPRWGVVLALNRHRRLVGVSAFIYAALHLTTHVIYEGGFGRLGATLAVAVSKPFQLIGLIAFGILLTLAATSTNAAQRWLGGRNWKRLHRLAYVAAALAAYHQAAARKIFPLQVLWIFLPLIGLEVARLVRQRRSRVRIASPGQRPS